jgi:hypothetical protein
MDSFKELYELIEGPSIFEELLAKSLLSNESDDDLDWASEPLPVAKPKVNVNTGANKNNGTASVTPPAQKTVKPKTLKIKAPSGGTQGTPLQADTHTSTTVDSSLVPVKQMVNTPEGMKSKTFHKPAGDSPQLTIPADKKNPKKLLKKKPASDAPPTYVSQPEWDDKSQYYHDNLKVGDTVGFNGYSTEHGHQVPVESEVVGLNPDGKKHIQVRPLHKDAKGDPNAEPMNLHYAEVKHFKRANPDDPNKKDHYEYNGEYQKPQIDSPPEAESEKKLSPEDILAKMQKRNEILKKKQDGIKKHVAPGDIVEFYKTNPETGKLSLEHGLVHDFATTGADGKKPKAPTSIPVQTGDGFEEVPFDRVNRFGKHIVNRVYMHKYDPDKEDWDIDDEKLKGKAAPAVDKPFDPKQNEDMKEEEKPEVDPKLLDTAPNKDEVAPYATVFKNAGISMEGVENGKVYFTIPNSSELFNLPINKVSPEAVDEIVQENTPKKKFGEEDHWANKLQPNASKKISSALANVMQYAGSLPARIIAAKNRLLHPKNDSQYFESASEIEKFLKDPMKFGESKPPKNSDYFKKEHNLDVDNPSSIEHAPKRLSEYSPNVTSPFLISQQESAASKIRDLAKENGLFDVASKIKDIDPKKENTDLLHYYKNYIDNAMSKAGKGPSNIKIPSVEQANLFDNMDDLTSKMESLGLDHPYYQGIVDKLNHLIENNPNSSGIDKLFGELNDYVNKNGKNDPRHQIDTLKDDLNGGMMKNIDPEDQEKITKVLKDMGDTDPKGAIKSVQKILSKYGQYEPDFHEGQDRDLESLNYINSKLGGGEKNTTEPSYSGVKGHPTSVPVHEGTPKPTQSYKKPAPQQGLTKHDINKKDFAHSSTSVKNGANQIKLLMKEGHPMSQIMMVAGNQYNNNLEDYNRLGAEIAQEFTPMKSIFDTEDKGDDDSSKELYSQLAKQATDTHSSNTAYMKNAVLGASHSINIYRKHFLQHLDQYNPDVKDNLKAIDEYANNSVKNNSWEPLPEGLATTEMGKKFLQQINNQIDRVRNIHKMTGVPMDSVYKALSSDIESEKTIAKRDFGIAIKKAFGDTNSKEIAEHFNSYLDEIVENTMFAYPNIPVKVRKSITRYFVKCVNSDVIKNNNDIEINKSLKSVYSESSLNSMIKKISMISTDIKSLNKPIFYIDIDNDHEVEYQKSIDFIHEELSKSEWVNKLKNIQDIMIKGGIIVNKLPENRLKKFISDNSSETISRFYNQQVELVKTWQI